VRHPQRGLQLIELQPEIREHPGLTHKRSRRIRSQVTDVVKSSESDRRWIEHGFIRPGSSRPAPPWRPESDVGVPSTGCHPSLPDAGKRRCSRGTPPVLRKILWREVGFSGK
jgi:hypothetical protein